MATDSKFIGVGVVVEPLHIRAVMVEVGPTGSAVERFASVPRGDKSLPRIVRAVVKALDPTEALPVGIATGSISDADRQSLVAALGSSRTVQIRRRTDVIAHLGLAPGTKLDDVTELDGCSVPAQLFEVRRDVRFPDLLGAIGVVFAMAREPGADEAAAGSRSTSAPAQSRKGAGPTRINLPNAGKTKRPPINADAGATKPVTPAPVRIDLDKSDLTQRGFGGKPPPAPPAPTERAPGEEERFDSAEDLSAPAPAHLTLAQPEVPERNWNDTPEPSFEPPMVRLPVDESADQAMTRSRKRAFLARRRPLPLAIIALVLLVGVGVALGVFLADSGSSVDQAMIGLLTMQWG